MSERITLPERKTVRADGTILTHRKMIDIAAVKERAMDVYYELKKYEDILYDESGNELISIDRLREIAAADQAGIMQIIDKEVFCRNADKREGKCAGYHESLYSEATLKMCAKCPMHDPDAELADYYDDEVNS